MKLIEQDPEPAQWWKLIVACVGLLIAVVLIRALGGAIFLPLLLFGIVIFIRYSFRALWWILGR